jgi:hypothetical protein
MVGNLTLERELIRTKSRYKLFVPLQASSGSLWSTNEAKQIRIGVSNRGHILDMQINLDIISIITTPLLTTEIVRIKQDRKASSIDPDVY